MSTTSSRWMQIPRSCTPSPVVNTASRRVLEKCGLRQVRVFHADWPQRIPGDEHGDVEYALDRAEWQRVNRRPTVQEQRGEAPRRSS